LIAKDKSVDGFKTGHTEVAGYCLVASARRGDMRLISVVLGSGSDAERTAASQSLLNYGFRFFETRKLYSAGDVVASVRVWKGSEDNVDVKVRDDVYIVHPRGKFADVSAKAVVNEPLEAPLSTGDRLGVIQVESENTRLAEVPLVSARSIEVGSWFSRLVDTIELLFE
jgi:D-alanyl-D-alanine carboxypeptidase (penicillin-binding protein 5/6)